MNGRSHLRGTKPARSAYMVNGHDQLGTIKSRVNRARSRLVHLLGVDGAEARDYRQSCQYAIETDTGDNGDWPCSPGSFTPRSRTCVSGV